MSMRNLKGNIRGDTIVEVLISIAILSVILTGAYVTSNQSLNNIRQAQERIQALGFAQTQIEDLRAQSATAFNSAGNAPFKASGGPAFCFDSNNTIQPYSAATCTDSTHIYTAKINPLGATNPANGVYSTYAFQVVIDWQPLDSSSPINQMVIVYRVAT